MTDILDVVDELNDDFDDLETGSEVDVVEGELIDDELEFGETKAREITEAIRASATATFLLLAEAHRHKAHKALGYETWSDYVKNEFDMTPQRAYQLLDLSKAVTLIESAVPEGTEVRLTEAQARDIKRELPRITEKISEETKELSPEEAASKAEEIVEEHRAEIARQKKEDDKAVAKKTKELEEAEREGYNAGIEAAADAFLEANRDDSLSDEADDTFDNVSVDGEPGLSPEASMNLYNFFNMLSSVNSLPEPDEFIRIVPSSRHDEIENQLLAVTSWLNRFQTLWELKED